MAGRIWSNIKDEFHHRKINLGGLWKIERNMPTACKSSSESKYCKYL